MEAYQSCRRCLERIVKTWKKPNTKTSRFLKKSTNSCFTVSPCQKDPHHHVQPFATYFHLLEGQTPRILGRSFTHCKGCLAMEPLRPAGLPPLSVGMGGFGVGSKKPEEKPKLAPPEVPIEEKESPFECTMGTRGVTLA